MEEQKKSNLGQALGIAGLILGIIALVISFIPCLGMYAIFPGIIAIILSAVALSQVSKTDASKGLVTAALIISILGTLIAAWQMVTLKHAAKDIEKIGTELKEAFEDEIGDDLEEAIEELEEASEEFDEEMEEAVEELEENIEEAAKELEEALEEIEEEEN